MLNKKSLLITLMLWLNPLVGSVTLAQDKTAQEIIQAAMDNWRGTTSYSEMTMTIKREDWQRSMSMHAWTSGTDQSLIRVTEPKKDAGNATLTKDNDMWTYAPKINKVIKIPSSMMSQNWMGSDFSNKDISRSTDILNYYDHRITGTEKKDGHTRYQITSIPHQDAPVVWGKEVLEIRDDYVITREEFWDQQNQLVKVMETSDIMEMDGRMVAMRLRMYQIDTPNEWTQIEQTKIQFDLDLADSIFTLSNLRNPRQ